MSFPELNSIIGEPGAVVGNNIRVCRGCLSTETKLFSLDEKRLDLAFGELTGVLVSSGLVCCVCLQLLRKFQAFRWRVRDADAVLQQFQQNHNESELNLKSRKVNVKLLPDLISTVTLHIDLPPEFNTPLSGDDSSIFIKTKEEENDSNTLIGEFITKDDIDIGHIKQDDFEPDPEPEQVEHNDEGNDLSWPDQNYDSDSEDNTVLTKLALPDKRKSVIKKAKVKKEKKVIKKVKKELAKIKRIKVKKEIISFSEEEDSKPEKKPKKPQEEDLVLSTKIAATLRSIWKKNKNKDIYKLFERIYNESLKFKLKKNESKPTCNNSISDSYDDDDEELTKKKITLFLELVQKLSQMYNVDTEFVRLEDLRREMDEKRNSGKFKIEDHGCELCCKQYNFYETYKRHMDRNHNPAYDTECDICRYKFKTQRDFLAHIMMHARNIKCQDCNAIIPSKWCDAKKHAECHRGIMHPCTMCNQTFTRKKSLAMHLRSKHRSQLDVVMCLLCGDTYNGDEGLRIHIRCIHKQAALCRSCGVWFNDADTLAAHIAASCQPHQSSCPMCGANFDSVETMLEHHKQLHPMYKCAECKITFEDGKICVHFKYNHNLVKGKMKAPKRKSRLYNRDIICEVCGKNNFTCVATLKIHQRIHTGERPYSCEICQKTFRMRSDLKLHSAIHTGERSYKCPYCPRSFRQPPHLKSHLPTHTKEKAYACEICHKRFTQRANMQEHVRTIHEGLPPKRRQRHSKIFEA